jgi:F-type H+-transporting ATPase subunit a
MEHHISWITRAVNHYLGHFVLALLAALHIKPTDPALPIPEYVVMGAVVLVIGTVLALWLKTRLSVERPGATQQMAEMLLTNPLGFGIRDLLEENAGREGRHFIAFTGAISVFILLANLLGVVPLFSSPTGDKTVPFACALLTFLYFNYQGLRHHGATGYLLTFAGSPRKLSDWLLSILLFPVEIISTTARLLSLTVRLWANIFASDLIYMLFLGLLVQPVVWAQSKSLPLAVVLGIFPALIPLLFIALHIFVSLIQAYVFTVLPSIYLGMATADEH